MKSRKPSNFSNDEWNLIKSEFWKRVDMSGGINSCWPWKAERLKATRDYGIFTLSRVKIKIVASRLSYMLHHDVRIDDLKQLICHNCPSGDLPSCCNPNHLFLGDHLANSLDAVKKGRASGGKGISRNKGKQNGRAKLDENKVRYARKRRKQGVSHKQISLELGVTREAITRTLNGENWSHVK